MKLIVSGLIAAIVISLGCYAKELKIDLDFASFRHETSQIKWELYYSYFENDISYRKIDSVYLGELHFEISFNSSKGLEHRENWLVKREINYLPDSVNIKLIGIKKFIVNPGIYDVVIKVKDLNDSSRFREIQFPLIARSFPEKAVALSDIQLAQFIESEESPSQNWMPEFNKNTLFVIPNPLQEYYDVSPLLKAYVEVYNAKTIAPKGYNIDISVFDGLKNRIFTSPGSSHSVSDGMVEIIELPIEVLPTGKYFLQIKISFASGKGHDTIYNIKPFYFINTKMGPQEVSEFIENETFESSEFSTMNEDQVQLEYQQAKCIAERFEMDRWDALVYHEARQRFLFAFWRKRDTDPSTVINERLVEFRRMIEYANTYFSLGNNKRGWKTDRGRVLLMNGMPTKRDVFPANEMARPYEVWYFDNIQGGTQYYFVDTKSANRYILVHSTAFGEVYNPNWYQEFVPLDFKQEEDLSKPRRVR